MIDIQVTGDIDRFADRARAWKKLVQGDLLRDVAELTTQQARERITSTQHSPDLRAWPPRKHHYPHPMLRKSGALLRSLRKQRTGAAEYNAGVQGSFAARVSAYAVYQQYGTRRGIDPRPFVGVGFHDADEIEDLIQTFVELRF